jgi:hypothetical protein
MMSPSPDLGDKYVLGMPLDMPSWPFVPSLFEVQQLYNVFMEPSNTTAVTHVDIMYAGRS